MYAVAFKSQDNKQLDLSVVGDAGYALILPWMPVPVSMITLTQVVSGTSTVVARAAIGREIPDLKHLALTVDGTTAKVYFRGRLLMVGTLSTTMTIDRVELQGGTKDTLLSEMLLMPRVAEPEDIKTWWNLRAPFYDPSPVIQEDQIPAAETWNQAVHDAQRALADAADAQATADGKVTTYYQDTEPIAEALGDLWIHTGEDNKLYRWSGSSWEVVQDKKIQEAVQKAEDAQATADGKIVTFYQSTPPTATAVGDLWVDVGDNNRLYRWDGTEWVDIQDKSPIPDERIPSAESWNKKNRTYYQDTPPTGTHSLGDVWFDTSDHNRRHWWDGSKWVDAEDVSPIDASQRPITARGLGGVIEMDHEGMRFIRKADNEITLQMDIETGSAFFKGDITGATGTFSGGISGGNGAFELTPSKLTIDTPQFTLDEAGNATFSGDITGATGTFSGHLSAERIIEGIEVYGGLSADHIKAGEISYDKLKVRFAKVTSALGGYYSDLLIPPTTLIEANSPDDWNLLIWAEGLSTFNRSTRLIIYHQSFDTLMGPIVFQFSYNGSVWSDQIDLAYCSASDNVEYTVGDHTFRVAPIIVTNERVEMFVRFGEGVPRTPHLRFKRHAIA